ncbi:hypothetical protein LSH36_410g03026 [Paralvinella palmiformis]|uniref:Uncharacterized protein n=1 Tax=Paralvinella palmiformis TaxID=53620 RepID=A0AAD9JCI6_9ANNE|nr:hypothetical protein LSH36_410g03026 [Paralvinella palmiformis]
MLFGILLCLKRRKGRGTRGHTTDPLLSEHHPDPEDTMSNIYDKTRIVRCPHGLAAVTLNPEGLYYPEGMERYPHVVSMTTVSTPYPGDRKNDATSRDRTENGPTDPDIAPESPYMRDGATNKSRTNTNSSLTEAFTKRKQQMESTFGTFRSGLMPGEVSADPDDGTYRSLHPQPPIDLIRDSRPYRELNPETLATECTCSLGHSPSHTCSREDHVTMNNDSAKINTAV